MHNSEDHSSVIRKPIVDPERKAPKQDTPSRSPDLRVCERSLADPKTGSQELIEECISQTKLLGFILAGSIVDVALCCSADMDRDSHKARRMRSTTVSAGSPKSPSSS
jgi:hypothetical protein